MQLSDEQFVCLLLSGIYTSNMSKLNSVEYVTFTKSKSVHGSTKVSFCANMNGYKHPNNPFSNCGKVEFLLPQKVCVKVLHKVFFGLTDTSEKGNYFDYPDFWNYKSGFLSVLRIVQIFLFVVPFLALNEVVTWCAQLRISTPEERRDAYRLSAWESKEIKKQREVVKRMPVEFNKRLINDGGLNAICKHKNLDLAYWQNFIKITEACHEQEFWDNLLAEYKDKELKAEDLEKVIANIQQQAQTQHDASLVGSGSATAGSTSSASNAVGGSQSAAGYTPVPSQAAVDNNAP